MNEEESWGASWAADAAPPDDPPQRSGGAGAPAPEPQAEVGAPAAAPADPATPDGPAPGPLPQLARGRATAAPRSSAPALPRRRGTAPAGDGTAAQPATPAATLAPVQVPAARAVVQVPAAPAVVPRDPGGISSAALLRTTEPAPTAGWRRLVHQASGGRVNPRPSAAQSARDSLLARMRRPVSSCQHVAVVSLKGGVGKTTTAVCLGATLATARADQVVVLDANPDRGSLADRLPRQTDLTVRDLLAALPSIRTYADLRHFTSQGRSRLESLASESDPAASRAFSEADFRQCAQLLDRYYQVLVADSGTGLLHSAMAGVLGTAQHLVLVASPSIDGARSADATLDWLTAHGYDALAVRAVTVVSSVLPGGSDVDESALRRHFTDRTRQVVAIPHDPHLEEGGEIDPGQLRPRTRDAYAELAAAVADAFV